MLDPLAPLADALGRLRKRHVDDPWRDAPERMRQRGSQRILAAISGIALVTSLIFWGTMVSAWANGDYEDGYDETADEVIANGPSAAHWLAASLTLAIAIGVGLAIYARRERAWLAFRERVEGERRGTARAAQLQAATDSRTEMVRLTEANRAVLDEYQEPVRRQARMSFVAAQVAIAVGFGALVLGIVTTVAVPQLETRLAVAGLAALGTALSGYLAKTYLRMYERAQDQLNYYFREPLVTSYLLTAERLAEKLEGERRQDAYAGMVGEIVRAAGADIAPPALVPARTPAQ